MTPVPMPVPPPPPPPPKGLLPPELVSVVLMIVTTAGVTDEATLTTIEFGSAAVTGAAAWPWVVDGAVAAGAAACAWVCVAGTRTTAGSVAEPPRRAPVDWRARTVPPDASVADSRATARNPPADRARGPRWDRLARGAAGTLWVGIQAAAETVGSGPQTVGGNAA